MIKFFIKIINELASSGKFGKYFTHTFGEIAPIVLGLLFHQLLNKIRSIGL